MLEDLSDKSRLIKMGSRGLGSRLATDFKNALVSKNYSKITSISNEYSNLIKYGVPAPTEADKKAKNSKTYSPKDVREGFVDYLMSSPKHAENNDKVWDIISCKSFTDHPLESKILTKSVLDGWLAFKASKALDKPDVIEPVLNNMLKELILIYNKNNPKMSGVQLLDSILSDVKTISSENIEIPAILDGYMSKFIKLIITKRKSLD